MRFWTKKIPAYPSTPGVVRLDDVRDELEAAREGTVILGKGEAGAMTLDLDFSHVLVAGGAGSGKSALVRSILAQVLATGGYVVILDLVPGVHRWASKHPDVAYARDIPKMHAELLRLGEELTWRHFYSAAEVRAARRIVVSVEHRGAMVQMLRHYWSEIRTATDPEKSPAIDALEALEVASPALRMHLVATSQRAAAGALGGADKRRNYRVRICAGRMSEAGWRMVLGDLPRPNRADAGLPGRFWVLRDETVAPLRALWLTSDQARHLVAAVIATARTKWGVRA